MYKITGDSELVTSEEIRSLDYPSPDGKIFLLITLDPEIDERLQDRKFQLPEEFVNTNEGIPQVIKYVNLFPPDYII